MASARHEFTTLSHVFWPVLDYLREHHTDIAALLGKFGYTEEMLRKRGRRIPRAAGVAIVESAMACNARAPHGFAVAPFVQSDTTSLLKYWAASSATLRESIDVVNRVAPFVDDSAHFRLEAHGGRVHWRFDMIWPEHVRPFMYEYMLGVMRAMRSRCIGPGQVVRQFHFSYPAPRYHAAYAEFLEGPVQFGSAFSGCVFDPETLDLRPPNADRALAGLLERCAGGFLKKPEVPETTSAQVRRLVSECLSDGEPSAQHVAQRIGTTASTLRRRLAAEGSSYRALVREVRLERSRSYLANASLSMTEIAYRVGFADTSAFFKAFKLMTGVTPGEYRAQLLEPNGSA